MLYVFGICRRGVGRGKPTESPYEVCRVSEKLLKTGAPGHGGPGRPRSIEVLGD